MKKIFFGNGEYPANWVLKCGNFVLSEKRSDKVLRRASRAAYSNTLTT